MKLQFKIIILFFILYSQSCAEGREIFNSGIIQYDNAIPIVVLTGSDNEIGEQYARAVSSEANMLINEYLKRIINDPLLFRYGPGFVYETAKKMQNYIDKSYINEMDIFSKITKIAYNDLIVANSFVDIQKKLIGCTTLVGHFYKDKVNLSKESDHSRLLFGRNLDYRSLNILHKHAIVVVFKKNNKIPFASITWPGLFGVFTGVNQKGLIIAVNEVYAGNTYTDTTPYAFIIRTLLENAKDAIEADNILKSAADNISQNNINKDNISKTPQLILPRFSTMINITVSDKKTFYVYEVGYNFINKIEPTNGFVYATNNFKETYSIVREKPDRIKELEKMTHNSIERRTEMDLWNILKKTRLPGFSIQSMIIDPESLNIDLWMGSASAPISYKKLSLEKYFSQN